MQEPATSAGTRDGWAVAWVGLCFTKCLTCIDSTAILRCGYHDRSTRAQSRHPRARDR